MKIHPAGYRILLISFLLLLIITVLHIALYPAHTTSNILIGVGSIAVLVFFLYLFRKPDRNNIPEENTVYAPADGKVVFIGETPEKEYFNKQCVQISIFMSFWNVHINWYPVAGTIKYIKYHKGKYLIARHPKSSEKNERNTIVLESSENIQILIRQIAGAVARRIITYAQNDQLVNQGDELGFIRFGSRVDLLLPVGTEILVKPGDKVLGKVTPIAKNPKIK